MENKNKHESDKTLERIMEEADKLLKMLRNDNKSDYETLTKIIPDEKELEPKYKIVVKAISGDVITDSDMTINKSIVDGISCHDNFADYSDIKGLIDGYMRFEYDGEKDELYVITEYNSSRELSEDELNELADETQGQWSDGVGEGFEQSPCTYFEDSEVYVSAWYRDQVVSVIQEKI